MYRKKYILRKIYIEENIYKKKFIKKKYKKEYKRYL